MKTTCAKPNRSASPVRVAVMVAGAVFLGGTVLGQAAPRSPVGTTWDCILTGSGQHGIAFLNFAPDGTFSGYQLDSTLPSLPPSFDDGLGRGSAGADGRNSASNTNAPNGRTNVFGFTRVHGPWSFDNRGRLIGSFTQVLNPTADTTNWLQSCVNTNVSLSATIGGQTFSLYTNVAFCSADPTVTTNVTQTIPLFFTNNNYTIVPGGDVTNWLQTCIDTNVNLRGTYYVAAPTASLTNWFQTCIVSNVFASAVFYGTEYDLYTNLTACFTTPQQSTTVVWSGLPPPLDYPVTFVNPNFPGGYTIATNMVIVTNINGVTFTLSTNVAQYFTTPTFDFHFIYSNVTASATFTFDNTNYAVTAAPPLGVEYDLSTNLSVCFSAPTLTTNVSWSLPPALSYSVTFTNYNYPGGETVATPFVVQTNINGLNFSFYTYLNFFFTTPTFTTNIVWDNVTAWASFSFTNTNFAVTHTTNLLPMTVNLSVLQNATVGGRPYFHSTDQLVFTFTDPVIEKDYSWTAPFSFANRNYTISPGPGTSTNAVSFVGTVTPGKHLTLTASASYGKVSYSGVPIKRTLPDLSGRWYGYKTEGSQPLLEFFDLVPFSDSLNPWPIDFPDIANFPNVYFTADGQGPGFDFYGVSILSTQKKIGFAFVTYPTGSTNSVLGASYGSFSSSRRMTNAVTSGSEEPLTRMKFNASWQHP